MKINLIKVWVGIAYLSAVLMVGCGEVSDTVGSMIDGCPTPVYDSWYVENPSEEADMLEYEYLDQEDYMTEISQESDEVVVFRVWSTDPTCLIKEIELVEAH